MNNIIDCVGAYRFLGLLINGALLATLISFSTSKIFLISVLSFVLASTSLFETPWITVPYIGARAERDSGGSGSHSGNPLG